MGIRRIDMVKKLMGMGVTSVHQKLDYDTAAVIADEFGFKAVFQEEEARLTEEEETGPQLERAPIVTVMGHVDHGKTLLLDAIRETNVVGGESGGITQHIGASEVKLANGRSITFIDTPGHEAFTAMRAHGAKVTDIAILVVAADDGVMPQTVEAIDHAIAAEIPIIVAINKVDLEKANIDKVKQNLVSHGLSPEDWGGETICVEVSAKEKTNLDELLEMILLSADMLELKYSPQATPRGVVLEARLDRGKGPIASVLVQNGVLCKNEAIVIGTSYGKVRAMINYAGQRIKEAIAGTPVEIFGLKSVPSAGDLFEVVKNEKKARQIATDRQHEERKATLVRPAHISLKDLFSRIQQGELKELKLVVKADVQGSVTALKESLEGISNDEVTVKMIHGGVGAVTENDVLLASASDAVVIGFHVRPGTGVEKLAEQEGVDIKIYNVIYAALDDVRAAMKGMLDPIFEEETLGRAEVRQTFRVPSVGTVAGSYIMEGKVVRDGSIRVVRDGVVMYDGKIASLRRFKEDVKEVSTGYECGIGVQKYNDIKVGDVLEVFTMKEIERD
jgi:translation initiation factor IF-2